MTCYCDIEADVPEFFTETRPIARKDHRCAECGGPIRRGDRYLRTTGKWDGEVSTIKTCVHCLAALDAMRSRYPCFCYVFGALHEHLGEDIGAIKHPGLGFAIGRMLVEGRREQRAAR